MKKYIVIGLVCGSLVGCAQMNTTGSTGRYLQYSYDDKVVMQFDMKTAENCQSQIAYPARGIKSSCSTFSHEELMQTRFKLIHTITATEFTGWARGKAACPNIKRTVEKSDQNLEVRCE